MPNFYIATDPEVRQMYLEHGFKYIRRYMVNGKWRYVYAEKDDHSAIKNAYSESKRHEKRANRAKKRSDRLKALSAKGAFNKWQARRSNKFKMRSDLERLASEEAKTKAYELVDEKSLSKKVDEVKSKTKNAVDKTKTKVKNEGVKAKSKIKSSSKKLLEMVTSKPIVKKNKNHI